MTMTTEKMTQKVLELQEVKDAVEAFLEEIEVTTRQYNQAVSELEEQVENLQESLGVATDLAEAKSIKQKINDTQDEIELVKQVSNAKVDAMYETLGDKAESFFVVHKEAVAVFKELDKQMIANTGLGALKSNLELMNGFARSVNFTFADVRKILLTTGIVPVEEQNRMFRGKYHLGQAGLSTELNSFYAKVSEYMYGLERADLL